MINSGDDPFNSYFAGKELTTDWTSRKLKNWARILESRRNDGLRVLEVGSWEGRSALFFMNFLPNASLVCVDTFEASKEHKSDPGFGSLDLVEARFDANLAPFAGRLEKIKARSVDGLAVLGVSGRCFDLIYVDGSHETLDVYRDAILSWPLLAPGGILIFDDYNYGRDLEPGDRPKEGIDAFLGGISGYRELFRGYQIILEKRAGDAVEEAAVAVSPARLQEVPPRAGPSGILFHHTLPGRESPSEALSRRQMQSIEGKGWSSLPAPARIMSPGDYPLLSFAIINWNYERYVGQATRSIRDQDYPNWDCLIVDNNSDDDSLEVVREAVGGDRRFEVDKLERNLGQMGAGLEIIDRLKGDFVSLVDADDFLFRNYASSQMQVRTALRENVGITCGNVIEVDTEGSVLSSHGVPADFGARARNSEKVPFEGGRLPVVDEPAFERIRANTAMIRPSAMGWLWAPGTSNVYRRDLLQLACTVAPADIPINYAFDTHFNIVSHFLAGAALIDVPLSAYRLHNRNTHTNGLRIDGIAAAPKSASDRGHRQRSAMCQALIRRRSRTTDWLPAGQFWSAVDRFPPHVHSVETDEAIHAAFADNYHELASEFGEEAMIRELRTRMPFQTVQAIVEKTQHDQNRDLRISALRRLEDQPPSGIALKS